ncbi:hypothetical protein HR45_01055 [Shewanella mangrovi]|uniref:DUF3293 domain-containing protein n=1 Tax=Shewanella mangrovi TaxID=1515746 RepID=A0A094LUV6_9GAMM|nr:DUF3293 domain-containing protein [Shewanella mangrovi]KFZ39018.1 hypothetical protein HR45_01055 [Shewanella mangrovi]
MDVGFNQLWQHYQNSCFLLTQCLNPPCSFAIITASNPLGTILSTSQNRLRDKQLQRDIHQSGCAYRALVGASLDLQHMEKSWAIYMDQQTAYQLAHKYQQNAFYFVEEGNIQLLPCHCDAQPVQMGPFEQFVRIVEELPEIHD